MNVSGRMPWGKHKGERLDQVPSSYLVWVYENSDADPYLRRQVLKELADRFAGDPVPQPCHRCETLDTTWPTIYRQLALACHPDRGGSTEAMQIANQADDLLNGRRVIA